MSVPRVRAPAIAGANAPGPTPSGRPITMATGISSEPTASHAPLVAARRKTSASVEGRHRKVTEPSGVHREAAMDVGPQSIGVQLVEWRFRSIVLVGLVQGVELVAAPGRRLGHGVVTVEEGPVRRRDDDRLVEPQRAKCVGPCGRSQHQCCATHRMPDAVKRSRGQAIAVQSGEDVISHAGPRQPRARREFGHAVTSKVERDAAEPIAQEQRHRFPHPTVESGGVREEQHGSRRAARSAQVVQGDPHAVARLDHRVRRAGHGQRKNTD